MSTAASTQRCRCGNPATATVFDHQLRTTPQCLHCAAVGRIPIPAAPPRTVPMPPHIAGTPAARIHQDKDLWHYQGKALSLLADGENVVVSTATASGRTLVFHLRAGREAAPPMPALTVARAPRTSTSW